MAQRHSTSGRHPREASGQPDDVFVAKVFEASTWAQRHSQTLILIGVVLALLVGGAAYYVNYRGNLDRQAVLELERVQQTVGMGDLEGGKAQLAAFLERFGRTRHASEARLLLGQVYLASRQPEQAIQTLSEDVSPRDALGPQAMNLLARAYEEVGRFPDAEEQYLEIADAAPLAFQRREALADAARVRSHTGDHAGAAELYRQILEGLEEESVEERGLYELRLAEAEHAAKG